MKGPFAALTFMPIYSKCKKSQEITDRMKRKIRRKENEKTH